jgi:Protein of unknown function (DUF2958)
MTEAKMELITNELREKLLANGRHNAEREDDPEDFFPVVKLFCPWGAATWLLTELDPESPDIAFGLCDLGVGTPEIGSVSLSELAEISGPGGLRIERDLYFRPKKSLEAYADEADRLGHIAA